MNKIMFLDDLVKTDDVELEFGLKTAGLVKLKKIIDDTNMPSYVSIPDFFSFHVSKLSDNYDLKEAYFKLTSGFDKPKIILARSSDQNEKPGKFETHPSLYIPEDKNLSFENWINAARKVKESGARAVICQSLVGDLEDFMYDEEYLQDSNERIYIKSFGGDNTSFFMNSSNFLTGDEPTIVACLGLPNKIARGDKDACLLKDNPWRMDVINLNHNYKRKSFGEFEQETIDIITLSNPNVITTLPYNKIYQMGRVSVMEYSTIPFDDIYKFTLSHPDFENTRFYPYKLFDILETIRSQTDNHVELEGCVNDKGIFLFQLREYELPNKNLEKLTEVSDDKILLKPERMSLGFNKFKGDLYVSRELIDIPKNNIFLYYGDVHYEDNFEAFKKYDQLIISAFDSCGYYAAAHSFGQTVQTLVELKKIGVEAISLRIGSLIDLLHRDRNLPESRFQKIDNVRIYKNVTAECVGDRAQIFFNE